MHSGRRKAGKDTSSSSHAAVERATRVLTPHSRTAATHGRQGEGETGTQSKGERREKEGEGRMK